MSSLFDDNDEEERQEQKLYEFYEVFSLEVRRQLLAKNIPIIQNVYDVLYPQTKKQLLSKNVPTDFTIDSTAVFPLVIQFSIGFIINSLFTPPSAV